jgi:hypothetical protein
MPQTRQKTLRFPAPLTVRLPAVVDHSSGTGGERGTVAPRLLSHTEIETALTCFARWDFSYGGRLAGDALKPLSTPAVLYEGRAWGAAVAAWHAHHTELFGAWEAHDALRASLADDAARTADTGWALPPGQLAESELRLGASLDHYIATAEPLPNLTRLEGELLVGIPSRGGKHASNRYRFLAYIDGFTGEEDQQWVTEFKWRSWLTPPDLLQRQRQPRWYAYALGQEQGFHPTGVIIDERLSVPLAEPKVLKSGRPSHDKRQRITPEAYVETCRECDEEPHFDVVQSLRDRQWQQRVPILFRPGELEEAGRELRDAAKLIRDLDNGDLYPLRHATRATCNGCRFKDICAEPQDTSYVDSLFRRTVPKRLRDEHTEREAA